LALAINSAATRKSQLCANPKRRPEKICGAAGINVVMNRCLKIEHARFHGGLHLAGFNTGVISSQRNAKKGEN